MSIPRHVALILDGNGRWARSRGLPVAAGHQKGVDTVERILDHAADRGVEVVTLYAFSKENWKRSVEERSFLFDLLKHYLNSRLKKILERGARLQIIGDVDRFPPDVRSMLEEAEKATADRKGFLIQIALSYGGRDEIVRAVRRVAKAVQAGELEIEGLDEETFKDFLDTGRDHSEPDLLIRTGGDLRISNFLLYQAAYTELFFTKTLWPDFSTEEFDAALQDFEGRERRFGART